MTAGAPTVIVGYDGSAAARGAVTVATQQARDGRIVIVHARESAPPQITSRWRELLEADHEAKAQAVLDALLLEGHDELADCDWEARVAPGRPADAILDVAAAVDADAIVVGSHGYGPVSALLGSVSHDLLRRSPVPVTVVTPRCVAASSPLVAEPPEAGAAA